MAGAFSKPKVDKSASLLQEQALQTQQQALDEQRQQIAAREAETKAKEERTKRVRSFATTGRSLLLNDEIGVPVTQKTLGG